MARIFVRRVGQSQPTQTLSCSAPAVIVAELDVEKIIDEAHHEVEKLISEGWSRIEAGNLEVFGKGVQETISWVRENILHLSEAVQPDEHIIALRHVCGYLNPQQQVVVLNSAMTEVERIAKIRNSFKLSGVVVEGCSLATSREHVNI